MDPKDFAQLEEAIRRGTDVHIKLETFAIEQEEQIQSLIEGIRPVIEQSYGGTSYGKLYAHAMVQALVASKMIKQSFMTLASSVDLDSALGAQLEKSLHDEGYDDEETEQASD